MIKTYKTLKQIKKTTHLVVILEKNNFDVNMFGQNIFNVQSKLKTLFKDKKSFSKTFFLGTDNVEEITFIKYFEEKKQTEIEFYGDNFSKINDDNITLYIDKENKKLDLLEIFLLKKYTYSIKKEKEDKKEYFIIGENNKELKKRLELVENIYACRDLVNMPANLKVPEKYEEIIKKMNFKNTKVKIYDDKKIKKMGLNMLDAVGKGSINKPRFIILEKIVDKKLPTYGLIGKGITFDAGGINLKGAEWLPLMKDDMGGSATVVYTMKNLDTKKLNCNIIACLPIAENLLGSDAYRPSDILTAYDGQTVEILNTDAEGRLVLADGIAYLSKNYKLDSIISVATLTGAVLYALGYNYAGLMGTDKKTIKNILNVGKKGKEKYWELPFDEYYIEKTKGKISDLTNISDGVYTGTVMGGAFLANFLNDEKFVHIDIAGVANRKDEYAQYNTGATGFGVDSLSEMFTNL